MTRFLSLTTETSFQLAVDASVQAILDSGLIIVPTDTTYAIGVNALDIKAMECLYKFKGRQADKPISIMLPSVEDIEHYCHLNERSNRLARMLLPGPVTLVLPKKEKLLNYVSNGPNVGIRIPKSDFCIAFMKKAGIPITATSANYSGGGDTFSVEEVRQQFHAEFSAVQIVVDGGPLIKGQSSTVLDLCGKKPNIIRKGLLSEKEMESVLQKWNE